MGQTAMLGTPQAQYGAVQPGYFCKGVAVWEGPWPIPQVYGIRIVAGQASINPTVASAMANADQSWWVFH